MNAAFTPLEDRFWPKVLRGDPGGCWLWNAAISSSGYGVVARGGRYGGSITSHRASWEIHHGPIPDGMCVMHKCDTPRCVNPAHLCLGTKAENSADMVAKCRQARGAQVSNSKLTESEVTRIFKLRALGLTHRAIAKETGVWFTTVGQILRRETWRHVWVRSNQEKTFKPAAQVAAFSLGS